MITSILLTGVGGQGTILTTKILSAGLAKMGCDVKMSEIHGMSQRGGTVNTQLKYGDKVNLERAVTPQTRLGGHFVQGHVDCCVPVRSFHREGGDMVLRFRIPPELSPYCVEKGFVAVNGISLTIVSVRPEISVHVIPATLNNTTLKDIRVGSLLNIETDILGKYVQAALKK